MKPTRYKTKNRVKTRAIVILVATVVLMLIIAFMTLITARAEITAYAAISDGKLNIRDKGGFDGAIIGVLYPGDAVTVIEYGTGYASGWTLVKAGIEAGQGWVKSEYLTDDLAATGDYYNSSGGRVRVWNAINGKKRVDWLKANAKVTVTSWAADADGGKWAFIGKGWVRAECLSRKEADY